MDEKTALFSLTIYILASPTSYSLSKVTLNGSDSPRMQQYKLIASAGLALSLTSRLLTMAGDNGGEAWLTKLTNKCQE